MKAVFSNFAPAKITTTDLQKTWSKLFDSADEIIIATGYVSNEAVVELHYILENNPEHIKNLQLLVGMPYLEGFSKPQYDSLIRLNEFLNKEGRGKVYISEFIKFHGKLYSFKNDKGIESLVGSANLTSFWDHTERTYETMLHLDQYEDACELYDDTKLLIEKIGRDISEAPRLEKFKATNTHFTNQEHIEKISDEELSRWQNTTSEYVFQIPIKTAPRSSLNIYFGQGRKNTRGIIIPRPWYEGELIVSKKITSKVGYPYQREFDVITDDGWRYRCKTQGQNAKNFRSLDDLKIFGKWIKNKLEMSGCLEIGEKVTEQTLQCYGNDHMELRSTPNPDLWLISFKQG